jgi:hypothetical protein
MVVNVAQKKKEKMWKSLVWCPKSAEIEPPLKKWPDQQL